MRILSIIICLAAVAVLEAADSITVRARLVATAPAPEADDLGTYTEGLVIFRWRVESVLAGELAEDEILVGHYGVYDRLEQPVVEWEPGTVRELDLVPFTSVESIQVLYASDPFEDDYDSLRFHHADQTLLRDVPADQRFDYGHQHMSENLSLAIALHEQLRLVAIGDSQVHNGFAARLTYPLENQVGPVAVNFAVPSTGLKWINTLTCDYLINAPELEYVVLGLNSRMFNAARKGKNLSPEARVEAVAASHGYRYDRELGAELFADDPGFIASDDLKERLWTGFRGERHWQAYGFGSQGRDGTSSEAARARLRSKYPRGTAEYAELDWQVSEGAFALLEALIERCAEHGVVVVGYTPPINPVIREFAHVVDEDGTTIAGHRRLVARWQALAEAHDHFHFIDLNRIGEHDLPVAAFRDTDHLTRPGATVATARLWSDLVAVDGAAELAVSVHGARVRAECAQSVRWIVSDGTVATGRRLDHRLPAPGHWLVAARWQDEDGRLRYALNEATIGEAAAGPLATSLQNHIEREDLHLVATARVAPDGSGRVLLDATASEVDDDGRFVVWTLPDGTRHPGLAVEVTLPGGEHEVAVVLYDEAGHRAREEITVRVE